MIQVVAIIEAKPGLLAEVLDAFRENIPAVHAEEGCIEYTAFIDTNSYGAQTAYGDDAFVVIEKWASPAALSAHARSPHMIAYAEQVKEKIARRTIHLLEAVFPKNDQWVKTL